MPRRRREYARDVDEGYEEGAVGGRYARRKSGNEALWIALGAAAVVGLVIILIVVGGSGEKQDIEGAKTALTNLFQCCIQGNVKEGAKLVDPREILREDNPNDIKKWRELPPARIQELHEQAFRWIQTTVEEDLEGLETMSQVNTLLRGATVEDRANGVDITFAWGTKTWRAFVAQRGAGGAWQLLRLDALQR